MKNLIFIIGMHRSGTSLLSQLIHILGATLPGNLMSANEDNPGGFQESQLVVDINNQILNACHSAWYDDKTIDAERLLYLGEQFHDAICQRLQAEFNNTHYLVLKDPRMCRLLPLWINAAQSLNYRLFSLHIVRDPFSVAMSLKKRAENRQSFPAAITQQARALLLWLQYIHSALNNTKHLHHTALIRYEDLTEDPVSTLHNALAHCHLNLPFQVHDKAEKLITQVIKSPFKTRHPSNLFEQWFSDIYASLDNQAPDESAYFSKLSALQSLFFSSRKVLVEANQFDPHINILLQNFNIQSVLLLSASLTSKGHQYRVSNRAESLQRYHISTTVMACDDIDITQLSSSFDLVIVFRAQWNTALQALYQFYQSQDIPIIYDIDDLVFDPHYMTMQYFDYLRSNAIEPKLWQSKAKKYQQALSQADFVILATNALSLEAKRYHPRCFMLKNGCSSARMHLSEKLTQLDHTIIKLGYASGTPSHQKDFKIIEKPLAHILAKYSQVQLIVLGSLKLDEFPLLQVYNKQIEQRQGVSFEQLPIELSRFTINLAPLEIDNPFCQAKSELKYFEAALVKCPTIASATSPMQEAITEGQNGYLCKNEQDWLNALELLINQTDKRRQIAKNAYQHVINTYSPEAQDLSCLSIIGKIMTLHKEPHVS